MKEQFQHVNNKKQWLHKSKYAVKRELERILKPLEEGNPTQSLVGWREAVMDWGCDIQSWNTGDDAGALVWSTETERWLAEENKHVSMIIDDLYIHSP